MTELPVATSAVITDIVAIASDPAGTPVSKGLAISNLFKSLGLGSDANGDIYYRAAGVIARLPVGSEGQILEIVSGLPAWADPSSSVAAHASTHAADGSDPVTLTKAQVGLSNVTDDAQVKRSEMGVASGVATLGGDGKIPSAEIPALAITDTFVVASEVAMLALTAEVGDVAVRTDENKCYILQTADPSVLGHWQELLTPSDTVTSVNSQTGAVSLSYGDVGAEQSGAVATHAALTETHGVTGAIVGTTNTQTLTNKRNTRRVVSITSHATPTINTDNMDVANFLALADDITSMTTNLSGTPNDSDLLLFRIKASGARTIAWGASFVDHGATPPVAVTDGKTARVLFEWDAVASAWCCLSAIEQP